MSWQRPSAIGGRHLPVPPLSLAALSPSTLPRRPGCHLARPATRPASLPRNLGAGQEGPPVRDPRARAQGVPGSTEGPTAALGPNQSKGSKGSKGSKTSKASKASQAAASSGEDSAPRTGRDGGPDSVDVVRRIVEAVPAQIPLREGPAGTGPGAGLAGAEAGQRFEGAPWPGLSTLDEGSSTQRGGDGEAGGGVYLKDLLREHQGRLYVPQEAVALASSYAAAPSAPSTDPPLSTAAAAKGQAATAPGQKLGVGLFEALSTGERAAFEERMRRSPEMSHEQFEEFASKGQVLLLASRGLPSESAGLGKGSKVGAGYQYGVDTGGALLVLLRDVPGEKPLHTRTWVLRCGDPAQAEGLLRRFKGQQLEVESALTAARVQEQVAVPASAPLPAASTISGRLVLELSIIAGLVQGVISFFLSIAGAVVGGAGGRGGGLDCPHG